VGHFCPLQIRGAGVKSAPARRHDQRHCSAGRLGRNLQVCSRAVVVAIGINALGYREVLGIAVGDSEAEGFWRQFLGSLKERGLTGTRLVISDAHLGLTAAIKRMFQGCLSWQRCRVHFLRNLLSHVPKAG
jgi:putative transposase